MLTQEEKNRIKDLYSKGVNITQISKKLKVSRQTIYNILRSDETSKKPTDKGVTSLGDSQLAATEKPIEAIIENDSEILELKKEFRRAELQKKIRELNMPLEVEKKIEQLEHVVYSMIAVIKDVYDDYWYRILDSEDVKCDCFYCGGELEFWEERRTDNKPILNGYKCKNCGRKFPY